MRKFLFVSVLINVLCSNSQGQSFYSGSQEVFAQAGLNIGVEMDPSSFLKINDYITDDSQEIGPFQFRYGSTLKLFQKRIGLLAGYAITKSGGINKVAMSGSKFNLGLNFCTGKNHYEYAQVGCYFNWGTRNYYFKNTLFIPSATLNPNLIADDLNLIRFKQRSIGAIITSPSVILDDSYSAACRIAVAVEYNLNSSNWIMGELQIPEYEGTGFFLNLMCQVDFGKTKKSK
jgi:hypothetical protein